MRRLGVFTLVFLMAMLAATIRAQQPARRAAAVPTANLAQVMRGILFPNSNILFDVQEKDPGAPKPADASAGAAGSYANVYAGWASVEGAAAAIEESVDLILKPRACSNGKPAPVARADYMKFAADLRAAGRKALVAANAKNQEAVSDSTNDLADACENCHMVYRDKGPVGSPARCTP